MRARGRRLKDLTGAVCSRNARSNCAKHCETRLPDYTYRCRSCGKQFNRYVSPIPGLQTETCPSCMSIDLEDVEIEYFDWEDRYLTGFC